MRRLYLSMKGFGDLVVLADALNRAQSDIEVEIIISKRLHVMASILMPSRVALTIIDDVEGVLPIYNIRKKPLELFKGVFDLRNIIQKRVGGGSSFILDIYSHRNEMIFASIPHRYLPVSKNIYTSYALEFNENMSHNKVKGRSIACRDVIIFPFGSSLDRSLSADELLTLYSFFEAQNIETKVACYYLDKPRISVNLEKSSIFYENSEQLIDLVKDAKILISVDTVAIHLANYFNRPTFVISDGWQFFIPPNVLESNRLYRRNHIDRLYKDLISFLNNG